MRMPMQNQLITDAQQAAVVAAEERRKREDAAAIKRGPLLAWRDTYRRREWTAVNGRGSALLRVTRQQLTSVHGLHVRGVGGDLIAHRLYEGDTADAMAVCEEALRRWVRGQVGDDAWDKLFTL